MASKGAASMAALSRQVARIPDEAVADLVRWFVPRSEQVGGTMKWYGHNIRLSTRLIKPRPGRDQTRVILRGLPAGAWAIKSYGRHTGEHGTTVGDRRWDLLVMEADAKFPDVTARVVDRRVRF